MSGDRGSPGVGRDASGYAAALAGLPGMGPALLVSILRRWTPEEAWRRVCDGSIPRPGKRGSAGQAAVGQAAAGQIAWEPEGVPAARGAKRPWSALASRIDPPGWWPRFAAAGIGVTWPGDPFYPAALVEDPQPPGVLFWRGSLDSLRRPCVAIVGTRRATPDGRAVAYEMARDLADAGICVVSGLALGIDGAAHSGALSATGGPQPSGGTGGDGTGAAPGVTVGVAASGVDVPYPRQHGALWERVARAGAVVSENLPGRPAQAWRFPSRNRLIAGLARMVVVVESHFHGGSLITAEAAIARGIDVRVVPGPVRSPASAGSNQLLYDGPGPVRDAQDVLDGLGIYRSGGAGLPGRGAGGGRAGGGTAAGRPEMLSPAERTVIEALGWRSTTLGEIAERTSLGLAAAMRALDELSARGLVEQHGAWWARRRSG